MKQIAATARKMHKVVSGKLVFKMTDFYCVLELKTWKCINFCALKCK